MAGRALSLALVGVLAIAAAGIGCGGDDGGSSQVNATVEITKPTFLKKAEAVCTKNYENVRAGYEDFIKKNGGPENAFNDPAAEAEYVDTVIVVEKKKTVEELAALGAPSGDEEEVEEILDAYDEGIEVAEDDPEAAMSSQGVFAYATSLAEKYGLENCRY
jgi:hypothetical protein